MPLENLSYELSVLSKAVVFKNLSAAAGTVGLSQPQLSKIVKKIEQSLSIILLDRSAKRTSAWTHSATRLAHIYTKSVRALDHEIDALTKQSQAQRIVMGTLEGLLPISLPITQQILENAGVRLVELDAYDLDRLEALFGQGELDLILTSRAPSKRKYPFRAELGYQSLDQQKSNSRYLVGSTFEYISQKKRFREAKRVLISNSLAIRKAWFERYGGEGTLPSLPKKVRQTEEDTEPILLLGADTLSPSIWGAILKTKF